MSDGAILGVQCLNQARLMRLSIKVQLHCGCCCERGGRTAHRCVTPVLLCKCVNHDSELMLKWAGDTKLTRQA
ncbi:hypothetical protein J6590_012824 [Homalodisca vitripennis]|nr:hypothetical protein J6590_012824 [Homalodisca vitripennis]